MISKGSALVIIALVAVQAQSVPSEADSPQPFIPKEFEAVSTGYVWQDGALSPNGK